jgi:hypothetical protein
MPELLKDDSSVRGEKLWHAYRFERRIQSSSHAMWRRRQSGMLLLHSVETSLQALRGSALLKASSQFFTDLTNVT